MDDTPSALGSRIRKARDDHDPWLSQEALARELGLSVGTVRGWESGTFAPSSKHVTPLCRALGIRPDTLFGWNEQETS